MFEQVFQGRGLARQRSGPLADERCRYLIHCATQQMSRSTLRKIAIYTRVVANALRLIERSGELITRAEVETAADQWVNQRRRSPAGKRSSWNQFTGTATRWLTFLGKLQPTTTVLHPHDHRLTEFATFMRRERGLSPQTVELRCWWLRKFLAWLSKAGLQLETLQVVQVDDILIRMIQEEGYRRVTVQTLASTLRAFFRYAEGRGLCRGLAVAVTAPRAFRHETLPAGPSWDDVKRVIAATQGDKPSAIRDRAILMLLAVYGLRSGELVALRLEDFDWGREMLAVRCGKRQQPRTYPLCRSVGDVVLRYLQKARPASPRRETFLTLRAPFRPLSPVGVGCAVRQRLLAAGVISPHYGAHALRHACATHLLAQGLSLKEIGDHLGHQSAETTRIYAKVDLPGLRSVGDFDLEGLR